MDVNRDLNASLNAKSLTLILKTKDTPLIKSKCAGTPRPCIMSVSCYGAFKNKNKSTSDLLTYRWLGGVVVRALDSSPV